MNAMMVENLAQAVGWTLIHSLWQGAALGGMAWVLRRERSPAQRYGVSCAALCVLIVSVVVTFGALGRGKDAREFGNEPAVRSEALRSSGLAESLVAGSPSATTAQDAGVIKLLACGWIAGVALMGVRALLAGCEIWRIRRTAKPLEDEAWQSRLRRFAAELGIARAVELCVTTAREVPGVIGHFKPVILVPAGILTRLSPEQFEALLWHELAHIRRSDFLVNILQLVCETLFFFHPVVWLLSRSMRRDREFCCDEIAVRQGGDRVAYAKALLSLEELRVITPPVLAMGVAGSPLKQRIEHLLTATAAPRSGGGGWSAAVGAAVVVVVTGLFCWPAVMAQPVRNNDHRFEIRIVSERGQELPVAIWSKGKAEWLRVSPEVVISDEHVHRASAEMNPLNGTWQVRVQLNNEGGQRLFKATKENIGHQVAVVVNGQVLSAPRIAEAIAGGQVVISGTFDEAEARKLANALSAEPSSEAKPAAVRIESYFIEVEERPSQLFHLTHSLDTASDNISGWRLSADEARDLVSRARQSAGVNLLAAPAITTLSGRSARVEIGQVPERQGQFSVNARGFVTSADAANQPEAGLIGQSIEFLPEVSRKNIVVAGRFVSRVKTVENGVPFVQTRNSSPLYVNVPKGEGFALEQQSKNGDKVSYLLIVVVPGAL